LKFSKQLDALDVKVSVSEERKGKQDSSEVSLTQTSKQVMVGKARISVRVVPVSSPAHCDGDDNHGTTSMSN